MKNERTTQDCNDITTFSNAVLEDIRCFGAAKVKIRSKRVIDVVYSAEGDGCFHTPNWEYVWNNDGTSVKSRNLDMIEIADK
jgi:hypothetical protein